MSEPAHPYDPDFASTEDGSICLRFLSNPNQLAPVRKIVEKFCADSGMSHHACDEVGLCVNEAIANVIRHAYAGAIDRPIEVIGRRAIDDAGRNDGRAGVEIVIRDWGNGVDPTMLPPRVPDPLIPGGLGLVCMRRMMSRVVFSPQRDGMLLSLIRFDDKTT